VEQTDGAEAHCQVRTAKGARAPVRIGAGAFLQSAVPRDRLKDRTVAR
jgi:hypothetical protein